MFRSIWIGALLGLFFSNAEGLRLLPFPEAVVPEHAAQPGASEMTLSRYHPGAAVSPRSQSTPIKKSRKADPYGTAPAIAPHFRAVAIFDPPSKVRVGGDAFSDPFRHFNAPLRGPPSA